jgi:endoglucanase
MKSLCIIARVFALYALLGSQTARGAGSEKDAFQYGRLLGRGINLGNALEAPREGDWGLILEAAFFQQIKGAGFDSVRIPIRWSTHAGASRPYEIDAAFFKRIDWIIEQALSRKLVTVINVHHYDEILREPDRHLPRLLELWKQIARRYRGRSDRLFFEVLNEPNGKLTDERWNAAIPQILAVVRKSNPRRPVIVGPGHWNGISSLDKLRLPENDRQLIVTFHYYSPFEFTHQGAPWVSNSKKWQGTSWTATAKQRQALERDFEKAAAWGKKNKRPLFLGEFGAYSAADMTSRACWTRALAREAEKHGMSWSYWEFGAGFGAYDRERRAWRLPLLKALTDKDQ